MKDKLRTLEQAAAQVKSGSQIVMSARMDWAPMAMLRQVVKQGSKELRLIGVVGGQINVDFPVGAGAAASVDTCSVGLGPFARTAPNFARHVIEGRIRTLDNT
jgi:acyl CoA:acetate/3-ketoacid CoA transferase alpha subunit